MSTWNGIGATLSLQKMDGADEAEGLGEGTVDDGAVDVEGADEMEGFDDGVDDA